MLILLTNLDTETANISKKQRKIEALAIFTRPRKINSHQTKPKQKGQIEDDKCTRSNPESLELHREREREREKGRNFVDFYKTALCAFVEEMGVRKQSGHELAPGWFLKLEANVMSTWRLVLSERRFGFTTWELVGTFYIPSVGFQFFILFYFINEWMLLTICIILEFKCSMPLFF